MDPMKPVCDESKQILPSGIRIHLYRTSDLFTEKEAEIREYENLDACVKTLLAEWDYPLIISESDDCDYTIEIYDDYRE